MRWPTVRLTVMKRNKTEEIVDKQKKVKPKKYMSLRNYLTAIIILIILFCTTVLFFSYIFFSYGRTVKDIRSHSSFINDTAIGILKDYERTDIIPVSDKEAVALNSMALSCNGRIVVVNRDYKVIYDTTLQLTGKYIIGPRLINTLSTGTENEKIDDQYSELLSAYDSGLIISYYPTTEIIGRTENRLLLYGIIYLLMILDILSVLHLQRITHLHNHLLNFYLGMFYVNLYCNYVLLLLALHLQLFYKLFRYTQDNLFHPI